MVVTKKMSDTEAKLRIAICVVKVLIVLCIWAFCTWFIFSGCWFPMQD